MTRNLPVVALVGRPNVGKSTLFNRIAGANLAAIHDRAGTTRDRQYTEAEWQGIAFMLIDTGGIESLVSLDKGTTAPLAEDSAEFVREIRSQAEMAIREADVIVLVVDIRTGVTAADEEVAQILRSSDQPVIIAASKGDNQAQREQIYDFYSLGLGDVFAVSGIHGTNVGDLLDAVIDALPFRPPDLDEEDETLKIAILGRPNVGKSSLLNKMLGEERVIVSPVAGTTRDAIDTRITYYGEEITLIDTAGIRRKGKIEPGVERYSAARALNAIKRSSVCLLLIDATEGPTHQDAIVAGYILEEFKSVIVIVNKWDLIEKDSQTLAEYEAYVRQELKFMDYVPVMFISALTGQRTGRILPLAQDINNERYYRISTAEVNRIVRDAMAAQSPPSKQGRRLKIRYASQVSVDPPRFLFTINDERLLHFSYERYLENQIRRAYPFVGTPIQLAYKATYDQERSKRRR